MFFNLKDRNACLLAGWLAGGAGLRRPSVVRSSPLSGCNLSRRSRNSQDTHNISHRPRPQLHAHDAGRRGLAVRLCRYFSFRRNLFVDRNNSIQTNRQAAPPHLLLVPSLLGQKEGNTPPFHTRTLQQYAGFISKEMDTNQDLNCILCACSPHQGLYASEAASERLNYTGPPLGH